MKLLCYLPEFRAKTEMASNPLPWHFIVKALTNFVGLDDEKHQPCLVRALRFYMDHLKDVSPHPMFLVVSPSKLSRPVSENTYLILYASVTLIWFSS